MYIIIKLFRKKQLLINNITYANIKKEQKIKL